MEGRMTMTHDGWRVEYVHYEGNNLSVLRVIPVHKDSMYREPTWYQGMDVRFNIQDKSALIFHGRNPNEQKMEAHEDVPQWIVNRLHSEDESERILSRIVINDSTGMDIFDNLKKVLNEI